VFSPTSFPPLRLGRVSPPRVLSAEPHSVSRFGLSPRAPLATFSCFSLFSGCPPTQCFFFFPVNPPLDVTGVIRSVPFPVGVLSLFCLVSFPYTSRELSCGPFLRLLRACSSVPFDEVPDGNLFLRSWGKDVSTLFPHEFDFFPSRADMEQK